MLGGETVADGTPPVMPVSRIKHCVDLRSKCKAVLVIAKQHMEFAGQSAKIIATDHFVTASEPAVSPPPILASKPRRNASKIFWRQRMLQVSSVRPTDHKSRRDPYATLFQPTADCKVNPNSRNGGSDTLVAFQTSSYNPRLICRFQPRRQYGNDKLDVCV
jgi:hypothetical protein